MNGRVTQSYAQVPEDFDDEDPFEDADDFGSAADLADAYIDGLEDGARTERETIASWLLGLKFQTAHAIAHAIRKGMHHGDGTADGQA